MANLKRLPKAVIESYEWQFDGACTDLPVEMFFLPENMRMNKKIAHEDRAKQICGSCPVRDLCLQHAVDAHEPYGIWGGTNPEERRQLREGTLPAAA